MGNQNTSGIAEEERAKNEAPEKVSSPDNTRQESGTQIQENERKDLDRETKTADHADSHDAEAETCPSADILTSDENEEKEGDFNDVKSNLEEGNSKINDEIQDPTYSSKGEMQRSNPNSNSRTTSSFDISSHEAVDMTSDPQQDHDTYISKGEMQRSDSNSNDPSSRTTSSIDISSHDEAVDMSSEPQQDHDLVAKEIVSCPIEMEDVSDDQVEKNEDNSVMDDIASAKGPLLETCNEKDKLIISPITTLNGTSSLQDLSASTNECLPLGEDNGLGNGDDRSHVDQSQPPDQAIDKPLIHSNDQTEMIMCEIKNNQDEKQDEVDIASLMEKVDLVDEVKAEQRMDQREEELKDPTEVNETVKNVFGLVHCKEGSIATAKNQENDQEIQTSLFSRQFSTNEFKVNDQGKKMIDNELKKSPSFDFGVPFDARSEESDQTPLLYQERTTKRSFSASSTLFQNRGVQTEVLGKSLRFDAVEVEVEEKTIKMERSVSESSKTPNHKEIARGKQRENSNIDHSSDIKSQEDCAAKENGKRKSRPSIFTTCICCTAAIS